ncbi:hypothetical protein GCM10020369_35830 [Cryptosporangium minutisporangium]|uniref:DUF3592 domain-containing protein n=1 Tax=Cryptosporangium minutisporangium TaxID=113569 RepID=A0ABP6SZI8_9ACTN
MGRPDRWGTPAELARQQNDALGVTDDAKLHPVKIRTKIVMSVVLIAVGVWWGAFTSPWIGDWLTEPHRHGTIGKCDFIGTEYGCSAQTDDGGAIVADRGQNFEPGDEFTYITTEHYRWRNDSGERMLVPNPTDWGHVALAVALVLGGYGTAMTAGTRRGDAATAWSGSAASLPVSPPRLPADRRG